MELINETNCKNCGGILNYDRKSRLATCHYCGTEYHLDNLGRLEEYKIELEIYGQRRKFYIEQVTVQPIFDVMRDIRGNFCKDVIRENEIKLELISY